ncbi:acetate transporter [Nitzschia inconspicua]|uniref:Acetate transporter n=1 Tax=Nitzschia inconspicua TaxID=303405 RepID=A0A9K3KXA5_9STRA|nr:acetate transporter [Nitzschia inconspicua]
MGLGNPAPLGLLAFGMTTLMLMYVETGWAETEFEYVVAGNAIFYGGVGQMLVAIFEIIHGSSFSFAVFFSYGAFWLGWAFVLVERAKDYSAFGDASYPTGMTLFLIQWGILSTCFFIVTLRKNICLIVVFVLLSTTFYLLAAATATSSLAVKRAAGYFGFFTAVGAFYTGVAELINEEWGRHVLPGLRPILSPALKDISKEEIQKLTSYDKKSNSMFLQFSGLQVYRKEHIAAIREGVKTAILDATKDSGGEQKVHVIVDYKNVSIAKDLEEDYWEMTRFLERHYYLSVRRFCVSSFGTRMGGDNQQQRNAAMSDGEGSSAKNSHESTAKLEEASG